VSKTVDDTYNTLGKALLYGPHRESLYGSYAEMQPVRKVVRQKVLDIVSRFVLDIVSDLCFQNCVKKNWEG
jgi:hypothetical protein